jgi:hypothetical protein
MDSYYPFYKNVFCPFAEEQNVVVVVVAVVEVVVATSLFQSC